MYFGGEMKHVYMHWSFEVAVPVLWNALPAELRNTFSLEAFEGLPKTGLLRPAFKYIYIQGFFFFFTLNFIEYIRVFTFLQFYIANF